MTLSLDIGSGTVSSGSDVVSRLWPYDGAKVRLTIQTEVTN